MASAVRFIFSPITRVGVFPLASFFNCALSDGVQGLPLLLGVFAIVSPPGRGSVWAASNIGIGSDSLPCTGFVGTSAAGQQWQCFQPPLHFRHQLGASLVR